MNTLPVKLAGNKNVQPKSLWDIEKLVYEPITLLLEKYNEFHGGKTIK